MENCSCGMMRKQYWLWRDTNGILHASGFQPTSGVERSIWAVNARDALMPFLDEGPGKHDVTDVDDASVIWEGRCSSLSATA
ncbi:MAG: hypothetical protein NVS2B16_34430 [Chloroflexota bacterium]